MPSWLRRRLGALCLLAFAGRALAAPSCLTCASLEDAACVDRFGADVPAAVPSAAPTTARPAATAAPSVARPAAAAALWVARSLRGILPGAAFVCAQLSDEQCLTALDAALDALPGDYRLTYL
ncbi:hypothetical protein M885DRAFT_560479 [Pelagophyceae sp. CCMP2097]|nr:hypothetical protein M885DRAFT_560479 [Pelagophyceae sp. CCMP2097]